MAGPTERGTNGPVASREATATHTEITGLWRNLATSLPESRQKMMRRRADLLREVEVLDTSIALVDRTMLAAGIEEADDRIRLMDGTVSQDDEERAA